MRNAAALLLLAATVPLAAGCAGLFRLEPGTRQRTDILRAAVSETPQHAHAWFLLGRADMERQEYAAAAANFRRAIQAQPDFEEARVGLGYALLEGGARSAAAREFEAALARTPNSTRALEGLAAARLAASDLPGAEDAARRALDLDPAAPLAHRTLGEVAYRRGQLAAAQRHFEQAAISAADDPGLTLLINDLKAYNAKYGRMGEGR
jgi:tetratricopeptide (TPR) repeat protein